MRFGILFTFLWILMPLYGRNVVAEQELRGLCIQVLPGGSISDMGPTYDRSGTSHYYFIPQTDCHIGLDESKIFPLIIEDSSHKVYSQLKVDTDSKVFLRALGILDLAFNVAPIQYNFIDKKKIVFYKVVEIVGKGYEFDSENIDDAQLKKYVNSYRGRELTPLQSAIVITQIQNCNPYSEQSIPNPNRIKFGNDTTKNAEIVSGALVWIISAKELTDYYAQKFLDASGKHSFRTYIDFRQHTFFLPVSSPDSVYKYLNERREYSDYSPLYDINVENPALRSDVELDFKFDNVEVLTRNWFSQSPYYISENREFIYRIIWVEGVCKTFKMSEFNKISGAFGSMYRTSGDSIKFMTSIISIQPSVRFKNMELWAPFAIKSL